MDNYTKDINKDNKKNKYSKDKRNRVLNWINNTPIQKKMIISYLAIVSVSVISVAIIMLMLISKRYEKQLLYSASQSFSQAEEFLEYRANAVLYASNLLQVDNQVQEILSRKEKDISNDLIQQNKDMLYMENYIYSLCNSTDIYQISLYVPDYMMYVNQEVIFRNLTNFQSTKEYKRLEDAGNRGIWLPPEEIYSADTSKWENVVSFLRQIKDTSDLNRTIGVQRVSIKYDDLYSIIDKSNNTESGIVCLQNREGELIVASNDETYEVLKKDLTKINQENINGINWKKKSINGKSYYININTVNSTDWILISAISEKELFKDSRTIVVLTLIVLCIILSIAVIIAIMFSKMMTSRISKLATQMEHLESNHEKAIEIPEMSEEMGNDEIGSLFVSYKNMADRINELINEQYENGKAVKHAELRALQSQINPHFLYNTLDLINWEALDQGVESIVTISRALAKFYKLSLNKGKEFSSLEEEIQHVSHYVQIQNFRFEDRIVLDINIQDSICKCQVLHIILQPLVENSILHGMSEMNSDEKIYISIRGKEVGEDIFLWVEDSGCGMKQKQMEQILSDTIDENNGYGVKNIHTRLQLCYGERYGLKYYANNFGGVTVQVRMPKIVEG